MIQLAALSRIDVFVFAGIGVAVLIALVALLVTLNFGALWLQAYMSSADVSFLSLIGMGFRQVKPSMIVAAKIMGTQAGLDTDRKLGMSTARLEAHFLAGGDVMLVLRAIIAAHRAGIDLDFDRAAAIDLAGRDVLDAVRTSVSPKVIDCPATNTRGRSAISAIAMDGVELRIRARVTVRTNIDQLIGGATEETIIARVGQGIITAIGSAQSHMDVMEMPDRISRRVLDSGLDANTAYEIVSIDIADIDVGENIGARLQSDQAEADTRVARARAEARRAEAVADAQEMKARVAASRAALVLAEAEVPAAIAVAFRMGSLHTQLRPHLPKGRGRNPKPPLSSSDPRRPDRPQPEQPVGKPRGGE
ncbi:MAG: flotillin-like protein FloA [Planctomycetales bacterium]|nr:flotillin-like protein FloA [Planctomycetales bacterium]